MIHTKKEFSRFSDNTNLLLLIDHAGRAGNGFFQTIFDSHPEVITCPWVHYIYSSLTDSFGNKAEYNHKEVLDYIHSNPYLQTIFSDLNEKNREFIFKMGGDINASIDRSKVKETFLQLIDGSELISRKDLILMIYFSFMKGRALDISRVKYILTADSISLRSESLHSGYSGKIIDSAVKDFEKLIVIHLLRDPRAGFTSSVHQFVNQLGNMYGLKIDNILSRIKRMILLDFDWDSVFVYGFWILYFKETFLSIERKKSEAIADFIEIKNEDINLNFKDTLRGLATDLGVSYLDLWDKDKDFTPTMLSMPWTGTGAYNPNYSKPNILEGDPSALIGKLAGPNKFVTQRWKERLPNRDVTIVEYEFRKEIEKYGYDFRHGRSPSFLRSRLQFCLPLMGEIPNLKWFLKQNNSINTLNKIIFFLSLPITYPLARICFFILSRKLDFRQD